MRMRRGCLALAVMMLLCWSAPARCAPSFEDTAFQGQFTTENLDRIIEEYELNDGWYWTTRADEIQTFHGHEDKPGWTDTAVNKLGRKGYDPDWYGCRWEAETVDARMPNAKGWGECFGYAQFICYLLSGEYNAHRNWKHFYSVGAAGGLKVGDLIRTEYRKKGWTYQHSAVVYSVEGDTVLFLQVSGGSFNLLRTRSGYTDGNLTDETSLAAISAIPGLKIMRSPLNTN